MYALSSETALRTELLEADRQVEEAQKKKEDIQERLKDAGRLRALLFEKGKPLEKAIIQSLKLLGFAAAPYKSGDSEFDVVFQCPEGRLLGEAEGKDSKPVNVDKLRQLAMNIHEDLQRDEVSSPAKGVLFGNGFRLAAPSSREFQFTEKCINASKSSSTALVATSELYIAVQYLANQTDEEFAQRCRDAILSGVGMVAFPLLPSVKATDSDEVKEPK